MCGRFVTISSIPSIEMAFDIEQPSLDLKPSYNIAPGQKIHIVINDGQRRLIRCRWGFIPFWAKDPSIGYKMINARSETITKKPSFKNVFKKNRCLIVADGFYEWRKEGKIKIPIYIHHKSGEPFGFAGLYNSWTAPGGDPICTCTIITTNANKLLRPVHDRMPVIIPKEKHELWLDPTKQDETDLLPLLKPFDSKEMATYDVSQVVNSPKNNSPACIKPI